MYFSILLLLAFEFIFFYPHCRLNGQEAYQKLSTYLTAVLFFYWWGGTLGTAATAGLLYQPRMIGDGDCGEIGGMNIDKRNRSTRRKPAPAPLCLP
jgi:hypothetical protein